MNYILSIFSSWHLHWCYTTHAIQKPFFNKPRNNLMFIPYWNTVPNMTIDFVFYVCNNIIKIQSEKLGITLWSKEKYIYAVGAMY
jgi:hypothetical protein